MAEIRFKKGDAVKVIDAESKLIERLEADEWVAEVHDHPKPKKRKKKEVLDEGDGLPEVLESEE